MKRSPAETKCCPSFQLQFVLALSTEGYVGFFFIFKGKYHQTKRRTKQSLVVDVLASLRLSPCAGFCAQTRQLCLLTRWNVLHPKKLIFCKIYHLLPNDLQPNLQTANGSDGQLPTALLRSLCEIRVKEEC